MPLFRPFKAVRPVPAFAQEVAAPPYDVLNAEEARQKANGKPYSFLHISKAEIDLPENTDPPFTPNPPKTTALCWKKAF